ncbi:MAG: hypothetical protein WCL04_08260, partial [Verrucomicrobiota bacterium]
RGRGLPTAVPVSAPVKQPLSSATVVAEGLPLNSGSLVANGARSFGPNTTGSLPGTVPTSTSTSSTQQRGGRQGGG